MRVLITGGSRGIGRAIAEELAGAGHNLLLIAKNPDNLQSAAIEIRSKYGTEVRYFVCDVGNMQNQQALYDFCLENDYLPDVLVLNAGIFLEGSLTNSSNSDFSETLNIDLLAIYNTVKLFIGHLRARQGAKIILIGSTAAYEPYPVGALYGVAKWALRGYAINLRHELMGDKIAVTFLAPGGTLTDLWEGEILSEDRLLEAKDIGKLVVSILNLSDQAVVEELIVRPMLGDIHE